MPTNRSRRDFLRTTALSAGPLLMAQAAVAKQLNALPKLANGQLDVDALRQQYLLDSSVTYLNHASIGTMPRVVTSAYANYLEVCERNPWSYIWGGEWDAPREQVRQSVASALGCEATEVALTHNTTELFNVLAQGLPLASGDEVLFSSLNHPGASVAFKQAGRIRGYATRQFQFPVTEAASMSADDIVQCHLDQIRESTRLLVLPHVDNILGIRHPIAMLSKAARAKGVEFIAVDGAQSIGMFPVDMAALGIDAYSTSPHKWLQAPKGLGIAYISEQLQTRLEPMWVTWGQSQWQDSARKFEDYGTRNLASVIALGDALRFQQQISDGTRELRLGTLRQHMRQCAAAHPKTQWLSPQDPAIACAIGTIGVTGENSRALAARLFSEHGIVLRPFTSQGINALRLSPNLFNQEQELEQVFRQI